MLGLDAGSIVANLRLDTSQFDSSLKRSQQVMQQFAQRLGRMGSYLTLRATLPIVYFAKKSVDAFAKFDDAMVRSAAVTKGATAVMRKSMRETALDMSTQTILSATELAEGYFALGQAGYEAAQSMKALPVVSDFAVASQIELDTATRYLVRTMEGLGMATEDPVENMEQMRRVADAFTFAAITTTAEIEDFAVAMTHAAAPALKLVNKSVEEGVSVLMAFAQAGIVAEEAGTLLWTTVRDLQRANVRFRSDWKKMGLVIYDTNGKMRNLADIFSDLEDKFATMSDEGKKVSLMMLGFQDRSLRGIQALMGFSDAMKLFQKYMAEGGNLTKKLADEYLKSFASQLRMAMNSVGVFAISIGNTLSPFIQKANQYIKAFVGWWKKLTPQTRLFAIEVAALVAVTGPLLILLSKMVTTITLLSVGFKVMGWSVLGLAKSFAIVTAAAAGWLLFAAALATAGYAIYTAWNQGMSGVRERLLDLQNSFKWTFDYLKDTVGPFLIWMVETFHTTFGMIISDWDDFSADLAASFTSTWQWLKNVKEGIVDVWTDPWITWSQGVAKMKRSFREAGEDWAQGFVSQREKATEAIEAFKVTVMEGFTTSGIYIKAYAEGVAERAVELGQLMKKQFGEDFGWVANLLKTKINEMNKELMGMMPESEWQEIIQKMEEVKKSLDGITEGVKYATTAWQKFVLEVEDIADELVDISTNAFTGMADTMATQLEQGRAAWKEFGAAVLHEINAIIIRMTMMDVLTNVIPELGASGGADLGKIEAETAAGLQVATAIEGAGVVAASSINVAAASLAPFSPALTAAGTVVSGSLKLAGGTVAVAIVNAGVSAAAAIAAAGAASGLSGGGSAKGNVFSFGSILPMALGGIVTQPTYIPMGGGKTAYIGEAGPEAVMPLSRSASGELGIKATQPNVNFNPQMKVIIVRDEKEAQLETMRSAAGEKIIVQKVARNRNVLG